MRRLTEFLTVLIFAMAIGALAMISILYLEGAGLGIALITLIIITIVSWQYLRKHFGRGSSI